MPKRADLKLAQPLTLPNQISPAELTLLHALQAEAELAAQLVNKCVQGFAKSYQCGQFDRLDFKTGVITRGQAEDKG